MTDTPSQPGRGLSQVQLDMIEVIRTMGPTTDIEMVRVSIEAYMAEIPPRSVMINLANRAWENFQDARLFPTPERRQVLLVASGWLAITFRQARATQQLVTGGLWEVAAANARSAVEHALYLALLANSTESTEVLDRLERRFRDDFDRILSVDPEGQLIMDLLDEFDMPERRPSDEWITKIEQVCSRFESGDSIYNFYRILSGQIHPGFLSAMPYFLPNVTNEADGWPADPRDDETDFALSMALRACAWAGWAADELFAVHWFTPVADGFREPLHCFPLTFRSE